MKLSFRPHLVRSTNRGDGSLLEPMPTATVSARRRGSGSGEGANSYAGQRGTDAPWRAAVGAAEYPWWDPMIAATGRSLLTDVVDVRDAPLLDAGKSLPSASGSRRALRVLLVMVDLASAV